MSVRTLSPGDDPVAVVRAAKGEAIVLIIAPGRDPLSLAQARAAIAPLAIERAPMRVNAVVAGVGAAVADVTAAAAFLDRSRSTTGQAIEVG